MAFVIVKFYNLRPKLWKEWKLNVKEKENVKCSELKKPLYFNLINELVIGYSYHDVSSLKDADTFGKNDSSYSQVNCTAKYLHRIMPHVFELKCGILW